MSEIGQATHDTIKAMEVVIKLMTEDNEQFLIELDQEIDRAFTEESQDYYKGLTVTRRLWRKYHPE